MSPAIQAIIQKLERASASTSDAVTRRELREIVIELKRVAARS